MASKVRLCMQVAIGAPPGDATIALIDTFDDSHPLMAAWGWAEELWGRATLVPAPQFEINDVAVTHPGDVDVTIRDRKFFSEHWSYSVIVEGRQQDVIESRLRPRPRVDDPGVWVTRRAHTGEPVRRNTDAREAAGQVRQHLVLIPRNANDVSSVSVQAGSEVASDRQSAAAHRRRGGPRQDD